MAQDFFVFDRTFVSKNHSRIRMNEEGGAREGEGEGEGGGGGGGGWSFLAARKGRIMRCTRARSTAADSLIIRSSRTLLHWPAVNIS